MKEMYQNQTNIFEGLAILANVLQLANYEQNVVQTSNDEIMQELQRQNKEYLNEIKDMLKKIDKRLENLEIERLKNVQQK